MTLRKSKKDLTINICREKTENLRKKKDLENSFKKKTNRNIRVFQICRFKKKSLRNKLNKSTLEIKQRFGNKI